MRDLGNDLDLAYFVNDHKRQLRLTREQRAKHLLVCGVPGSGKSKLFERMILADIRQRYRSQCGVMVIDPQGNLYESMVEKMAATGISSKHVIPIDLTRSDFVISYDLLRRRTGGDPAAYIQGAIDAMLHCFGQGNLDETPRLAKMLEAIFFTLWERERPLSDALRIVSSREVRNALIEGVQHMVSHSIWESLRHLSEAQFQEQCESSINRVRRFLSTELMRAILCQGGPSLDLGAALSEGHIVLVNLSIAGSNIKIEDARTFGSLLVSDAWTAAQARGASGKVKPFYVYVDEAQLYVTPAIAETLDQGRKFGLHFTFGMQYPSQCLHAGPSGEKVFDSLMANCRSKVVFQIEHEDDLQALALWLARQEIDPDSVKHEIWSTKVVGHQISYMPSTSTGQSESRGSGTAWSETEGENSSKSMAWSHTDAVNEAITVTEGVSYTESETVSKTESESDGVSTTDGITAAHNDGKSSSVAQSRGENEGETTSRGDVEGSAWSRGTAHSDGRNSGRNYNRSQTRSFGKPTEALQDELRRKRESSPTPPTLSEGGAVGPKQLAAQFDAYENTSKAAERSREEFDRRYVAGLSMGEGEGSSAGVNSSDSTTFSQQGNSSHSQSVARSHGKNMSLGKADGISSGQSRGNQHSISASHNESSGTTVAHGTSVTTSSSIAKTNAVSSADTYGGGEAHGHSSGTTRGGNDSCSTGVNSGTSWSPMLLPVMGRELSSRTYRSIDEQIFMWTKMLAGQADRHCVARLAGMTQPVALVTAQVSRVPTSAKWVERWLLNCLKRLPFILPRDEALRQVAAREHSAGLLPNLLEPHVARRKLPGSGAQSHKEWGK